MTLLTKDLLKKKEQKKPKDLSSRIPDYNIITHLKYVSENSSVNSIFFLFLNI